MLAPPWTHQLSPSLNSSNFCQQLWDHLSQTLPWKALEHHLSTVSLVSHPVHVTCAILLCLLPPDSLDMTHHDTCIPMPWVEGCWGAYAWMSSGYEVWLWEFMISMCCPTSRVQNVRSLHFQLRGDALWWIRTGTKDIMFLLEGMLEKGRQTIQHLYNYVERHERINMNI